MRKTWAAAALLATLGLVGMGCASGDETETEEGPTGQGGQGGNTSQGGQGGGDLPCGVDCSLLSAPECYVGSCNETLLQCEFIPAPATAECEDGEFCTVGDHCDGDGNCDSGRPNDCGMTPSECNAIECNESAEACAEVAAEDGASCNSGSDLCYTSGTCRNGVCGDMVFNDCLFSPASECNVAECDPADGQCKVTGPDTSKNGVACSGSGDLCMVDKTCNNGECAGGEPKDCSYVAQGCSYGECNPSNGLCVEVPVGEGDACFAGIDQCHVGTCNANQECVPSNVSNGTDCDDYNSCTTNDECTDGVCGGSAVANCTTYFEQPFEGGCPPGGWTLEADWECGAPSSGPSGCHGGSLCLATNLDGNYTNNLAWDSAYAETPTISLGSSTEPVLSFWAWWDTEGYSYDGFHLEVSTDGGSSFALLDTVDPAYSLTVGSEPAWGGHTGQAWRLMLADLSAFQGDNIILRFAFRSDSGGAYPGVYLDDVRVSEASAVPLAITSASPLPLGVVSTPYAITLARSGGSSAAEWSITGGTNHSWLAINPATGELSGTPAAGNTGPVSVTVRVEEPSNPGNFDTETLTFDVVTAVYFESFEGACPNGWTLTGDWECGVPSVEGPAAAYSGSQCLATQIDAEYSSNQEWDTTTATSPSISLAGTTSPVLTWRTWLYTESTSYDGFNLKISTNDGASYTVAAAATVTPAFDTTSLDGEPAWGGYESNLGWQEFRADLTAFAGQTIRLRFAFRSDYTVEYPGVYIDDVMVAD